MSPSLVLRCATLLCIISCAIDLFSFFVLFTQKRSQGNFNLGLFIIYTYICTRVQDEKKKFSGRVLSLDLHWKNKTYQLKRYISARKLKHGSFCLKLELLCFFLFCFCFCFFFHSYKMHLLTLLDLCTDRNARFPFRCTSASKIATLPFGRSLPV